MSEPQVNTISTRTTAAVRDRTGGRRQVAIQAFDFYPKPAPAANPWDLAPRQVEIMHLLTSGMDGCNKTIARTLGIERRTVETHLARAYEKMNVANRIQAVLAWDRWARQQESV